MYRRYKTFPKYKALYGIVFDYGEKENDLGRYEWMPDTLQYREPIKRNGLSNVKRVYVGFLQRWMSPKLFLEYIRSKDYEIDKQKAMALHK